MTDALYAHVLAIANGKGGVGKSSTAANVAWWLGHDGYRVCVVGADPQGDIGLNFGTIQDQLPSDGERLAPRHDEGRALRAAAIDGVAPERLRDVRSFDSGGVIDLVSGGRFLEELAAVLVQRQRSHRDEDDTFAASITALAATGEYHFVIVDCPPGGHALQESVLRAARWLVIPAKTDTSSLLGLQEMAQRFASARRINTALTLLGVFLFDTGAGSRRIIKEAKRDLSRVLQQLPPDTVMESFIPHLELPARLERVRGLAAAELEQVAESDKERYFAALRDGRSGSVGDLAPASSGSLAAAYFSLTAEILQRVAALSRDLVEVDA